MTGLSSVNRVICLKQFADVSRGLFVKTLVDYSAFVYFKDPVLSTILHAPLLLSLFARERGFYCFPGFCFSRGKHSIAWKGIITFCASGLFKLAILKYVLKCCLINKVHE